MFIGVLLGTEVVLLLVTNIAVATAIYLLMKKRFVSHIQFIIIYTFLKSDIPKVPLQGMCTHLNFMN